MRFVWECFVFTNSGKAVAYSEPCQTSKMKPCAKIVTSSQVLTIVTKSSISDVWQGSKYASIKITGVHSLFKVWSRAIFVP